MRKFLVAAGVAVLAASGVVVGGWQVSQARTAAKAAEPPVDDLVATTESEARAKAARAGKAVEVAAFRGEQREVYANPDGTMTAVEHTRPVRTYRDGTWAAVDSTLERRADGSIAPVAAAIDMRFSGGGDTPLATVSKAGKSISLDWQGTLPEPVLDGSTATYREVLPGVDLVIHASVDGFSHVLVVKSRTAAVNAALARIDMPVQTHGTELRTTESGGVEIVDAAGGGVMVAAAQPRMWDSSGDHLPSAPPSTTVKGTARAPVAVSVGPRSLILVPDQNLLTGPDTVYPVFIDPAWRDEIRSAWAMVDSGYPYEEYWKFDGATDEGLGLCPVSSGACNNSQKKRLFYRVSTSFYAGKDILSAEFGATLRHTWSGGNTSGDQANLYRMSGGISTSTNWSNQPSGTHVATAYPGSPSGGSCAYSGSYATEWDVKPEVQDAANKGTGSLTFGLRNATETDSTKWLRYCDNGHLRVNYNTRPSQPKMSNLSMTPGAGCSYDLLSSSYVNTLPMLKAYLFDVDSGDLLHPQFKLQWGTNDAYSWTAPVPSAGEVSGSRFELNLATVSNPPTLPENTPIGWIVRATDGVKDSSGNYIFGPWSSDGTATRCRFVIDRTKPAAPTITSAEFPDSDVWTPGVGEVGTFTFSSTSTDVVRYRYDFTGDAVGSVDVTAGSNRTASVRFMPDQPGPHVLTVQAFDNAGNSSVNSYSFAVSTPAPTGSWQLDDPAGSTQATDSAGSNPATPGSGVTFGVPGPGAGTAVHLNGSGNAFLAARVRGTVDTAEGFAVSAWVRLDDLARTQTAVSVNGLREAGFALGYDHSSGKWMFEIPDYDLQRFDQWRVTGGNPTDDWAHLVGVYNAETRSMSLYVNGVRVAQRTRGSEWSASGGVEIGRSYRDGHFRNQWNGDIAEVKVFDRVVFADEATVLGELTPQRQGYWQLNEDLDRTSPEYDGGQDLSLVGDAEIFRAPDPDFGPFPLVGSGHLYLPGLAQGCATVASPVLDTARSFSFTARVKLPSTQPGRSMTVLSVPGVNTDLLVLRYSVTRDAWEVVVAHSDTASPATTSVVSPVLPEADEDGQFLAVVHNTSSDEITLYVDGTPTTTLLTAGSWTAGGGLRLGRSRAGEYFSGVIDDVRAYRGVVGTGLAQRLGADLTEQPDL